MTVTIKEVDDALVRADVAKLEPGEHVYLLVAERKYVSEMVAHVVMEKLQKAGVKILWLWAEDRQALQVLRMEAHDGPQA